MNIKSNHAPTPLSQKEELKNCFKLSRNSISYSHRIEDEQKIDELIDLTCCLLNEDSCPDLNQEKAKAVIQFLNDIIQHSGQNISDPFKIQSMKKVIDKLHGYISQTIYHNLSNPQVTTL